MSARHRSARIVLAVGILAGLWTLVVMPASRPAQVGLATSVYTTAAEAALAGEPFYEAAPPGLDGYTFVYPPVVLLAFLPYGLVGDATLALLAQTGVTVLAGLALARLLVGVVERTGHRLARLDRALVTGFVLLSVHSAPTLVNGQINLLLGLLVALGLRHVAGDRPERPGRSDRAGLAGVALALAATVKLFPAAFGAYLCRRRAWRALLAAITTGTGLLLLGLVVFGVEPTATYLTAVVPSETKTGALVADPLSHDYLTVRRQLAAVLGDAAPGLIRFVGVAVVAPVVGLSYRHLTTRVDHLLAVLATIVGTLLVLPLEGLYFPLLYFPLVPLLFLVPAGRSRHLLLAGTLLTFVNATPLGVQAFVDGGLLGPELARLVEGITMPVFRVVLPATVGMWLLLAAAVHWQRRGRRGDAAADQRPEQAWSSGDD